MPYSMRGQLSDSARDARRYHSLLLALTGAIETVRTIEHTSLGVDAVLSQLLPDLAAALNAQHAFVALLQPDNEQGTRYFEFTAAWPHTELIGQRLLSSPILTDLVDSGQVKVIDPLGDLSPPFIAGLEMFQAVSAVLARMQTATHTRIVGICNQRDPDLGPYLAADGMALASIVELLALGVQAGERRSRELDGIQETSTALLTVLDLRKVLSIIVERAAAVFRAPATSVMLWDKKENRMVLKDSWGLLQRVSEGHDLPGNLKAEAAAPRTPASSPFVASLQETVGREPESQRLHVVLQAPMSLSGQVIGSLNIYGKELHSPPTREEIYLTEIFASQAALAVHRAELHEAIQRRYLHWKALHEASKVIVQDFAGDRKKTLDTIVQQAISYISSVEGPKASFGAIQIYDPEAKELCFESVYPATSLPKLRVQLGARRLVKPDMEASVRIGITGRTVLTRKAQRIDDVLQDRDYIGFNPSTRSELSVPLLDGDNVIGVLSLESDDVAAFDEEDEAALKGLADMAVIAIKNQAQTEQLQRAHALALLGAWDADVAHDAISHIGAIRRGVFLLQNQPNLTSEIKTKLKQIDEAAEALYVLHQLPREQSLSASPKDQGTLLDVVVPQEIEDLRRRNPTIDFRYQPQNWGLAITMAEPWFRRVLRHLLNNAVAAVVNLPRQKPKRITVLTAESEGMAEVRVEDTGVGIPNDIQPLLFRQPVPRADGSQGRGLLLVGFILEEYGGAANLMWSRPGEGSCFAFRLPTAEAHSRFRRA